MTCIAIIGNGTAYDPNGKKNEADHDNSSETRIKAGVIAGVVSGGVVIVSLRNDMHIYKRITDQKAIIYHS